MYEVMGGIWVRGGVVYIDAGTYLWKLKYNMHGIDMFHLGSMVPIAYRHH